MPLLTCLKSISLQSGRYTQVSSSYTLRRREVIQPNRFSSIDFDKSKGWRSFCPSQLNTTDSESNDHRKPLWDEMARLNPFTG